ncbi:MAG TPA: choice-of-anchor Q domain-containing protein [Chloroflexota bacterium]
MLAFRFIRISIFLSALLAAQIGVLPSHAATFVSSSVVVTPTQPAVDANVSIVATFTSPDALLNVILDVEVRDATNTKVFQQAFSGQSLAATVATTVTSTWRPTTNGTYTVKTGVFSANWSTGYGWNDAAGTITVGPPPPPPAAPRFTSSATVNPATVAPAAQATITATFTSTTAVSGINIDVEVRNATGTKVFQQVFPAQVFTAGQTRTFTSTWAVASGVAPGSYTVKTGAFSSDWATGYGWNDAAATITVAAPSSQPGYYVDCTGGNDANPGTDATRAWSTLSKVNQATLKAGDAIWLKRGCTWTGPLNLRTSGTSAQPIKVGAYGSGSLPIISNAQNQIDVNASYIVIDSVYLRSNPDTVDASCNNNPIGSRAGVTFHTGSAYNVVQNSTIADMATGINITPGSHHNQIKNNELTNNKMMFNVDPYTNDGGGHAILVEGDFNDIAYNRIHDSLACSRRYGYDGDAVEMYGGHDNTIHHNLTWNNWQFTELSLSTTSNNVYAYNIVNGHNGVSSHVGPTGTKIYNNVFYSTGGSGDNGVVCSQCSTTVMTFKNNIVWAYGALSTSGRPIDEGNNLFWAPNGGPYFDFARSVTDKVADPRFVSPGSDFHLQSGSPAANAGTVESVNAGWRVDLDGRAVPTNGGVDIGPYELP